MKLMADLLLFITVLYVLSCSALYFFQDKLIFFPPLPVDDVYKSVEQNEISYSLNNRKVAGWKINSSAKSDKTILYFGGNAEDVVYMNFEAHEFNVRQVLAFNHPGYGKSSGKASQESLYSNALDVYDKLIKDNHLETQNIVIVGRSLGSSVASFLAANRNNAGLILITPFDSIKNIASSQYKFFPVKYLIRHPFPTVDYIDQIKSPVLMLAAESDEIIATENLNNLKYKAGENNKLVVFPGVGHNTIQTHQQYYMEINNFINTL